MPELKKTPLYEIHQALGAKIVPFAGWEMPVQYSGVIAEHRAVRKAAGLFDVSHMGQIDLRGRHAIDSVQRITTNDASCLQTGEAQYSIICYPNGGIVDDTIVYKLADGHFMLCVNASNTEKDFKWIKDQLLPDDEVEITDVSSHYALIAIQGPKTPAILKGITNGAPGTINTIGTFCFKNITVSGIQVMASRAGYTGEDGFELYTPPAKAADLWKAIMEAGEGFGLKPAGLGARDTLRLEMKYSLYGNDIDANTTPLEANLGWVVKLDKGDFIGRESLLKQKETGIKRKLVCLEMEERGIPRHGYEVTNGGRKVGHVTSGTMSPTLGIGIAMAYIDTTIIKEGRKVDIVIRNKGVKAKIVKPPFYKKNKA